jgi:integrase
MSLRSRRLSPRSHARPGSDRASAPAEVALEVLRPLAEGRKPTDIMFPSTTGGYLPDGALAEPIRRVLARAAIATYEGRPAKGGRCIAGKDVTPHALRRSFISAAIELETKRQLAEGVAAKVWGGNDGVKHGVPTISPTPTPSPSRANLPN